MEDAEEPKVALSNLLPCHFNSDIYVQMTSPSFQEMKRQEAESRMRAIRQARRSPHAAAALQKRASLVGDGAKWRITNFKEVAKALARRA
jgi:hypothetical protein